MKIRLPKLNPVFLSSLAAATLLSSFFLAASAWAAPSLTVGSASGQAGAVVNLPIYFDPSTASVAGMQFNLTLPANLSTGAVTAGTILTAASKNVSTNLVGNTWTFIVFGLNQTTIAIGTLLTAQLTIAPGAAPGSLSSPISNVVFSDPTGASVSPGASTGGTFTVLPPSPVITSSATALGQVGVAFNYQIAATNSPFSFYAAGLPAGLSISTATGNISGIPSSAGTTSVTLSASNSGGTGSQTLTLTINPPAPTITSAATATGQVGVAFNYQITASNSPTSYNAAGLPTGLTINTATGLISGTPTTAGISNVTLSAMNAGGTGTHNLTLTINPPTPVITSSGAASGQVGVAFSYQITATNSPFNFYAAGLPAGLSISSASGNISGIPSSAGTTNVTLSATNSGGTGSLNLVLTVNPPTPVIISSAGAIGQVGVAFSYQITASNSPTSFNATGLPAGLTINTATGLISGTPTAAGTSSVSLNAINAGGTGSSVMTLTINPPAPVITSATTATGRQGVAFNYQITATNGPTSFDAAGLPAGLSISTNTGTVSGIPTASGAATVTLSAANAGGTGNQTLTLTIISGCDLNSDGVTNALDIQLEVNQALGVAPCTNDIKQDGVCNVLDVQRVVNAALGGACIVGP